MMVWFAWLLGGCVPELPVLEDPCAPFPDGGGLYKVSEEAPGDGNRKAFVFVPSKGGPRDVVYVLHGLGSDGPTFVDITGLLNEAERLNLVLVYPNGLGFPRQWNAGPLFSQKHDDLGYLEVLASDLDTKVCGRRTVAVGFSNGMQMAQRWACQGEALDAFAGAAGPIMVDTCEGEPVPLRVYQGTADDTVPIDGGTNRAGLSGPSLAESMGRWRKRNRCTEALPIVQSSGDTTCTSWECEVPTEQCVIEGWTHQWPGGTNGARTDADATAEILKFFDRAVPLDDATLDDTGLE